MTTKIYSDDEAVSRAAAVLFVERAQAAVESDGKFSVALSGGSTPRRLYETLARSPYRDQVPWQSVHVFWGDERCVPPDNEQSNERMARQALLNHVSVPENHVYPIRAADDPARGAAAYQNALKTYFGRQPRFDLVFLGLGENGHTASLFPDTPVLAETKRWVAEVFVAELNTYRVTLTAPVINQARTVAFLVCGANKAQVLSEVIKGPTDVSRLPAQLIRPTDGQLLWLVDEAAGRQVRT